MRLGSMRGKRTVSDDRAAACLVYCAVIEIRTMSRRQEPLESWPDGDYVACIAWLADLVHNLASSAVLVRPWPVRLLQKRRHAMAWTWRFAGEAGRQWILETLAREGVRWTPPQTRGTAGV